MTTTMASSRLWMPLLFAFGCEPERPEAAPSREPIVAIASEVSPPPLASTSELDEGNRELEAELLEDPVLAVSHDGRTQAIVVSTKG